MSKLLKRSAVGVALLSLASLANAGPITLDKTVNSPVAPGGHIKVGHKIGAPAGSSAQLTFNFADTDGPNGARAKIVLIERLGNDKTVTKLGTFGLAKNPVVVSNFDIDFGGKITAIIKNRKGDFSLASTSLTATPPAAPPAAPIKTPSASVPEPAPLLMLGAALLGLGFFQRRRAQLPQTA